MIAKPPCKRLWAPSTLLGRIVSWFLIMDRHHAYTLTLHVCRDKPGYEQVQSFQDPEGPSTRVCPVPATACGVETLVIVR